MMIKELTKEQLTLLNKYKEIGIEIGLATDNDNLVDIIKNIKDKTEDHRLLIGLNKAKSFKIYDSPFALLENNPELELSTAVYGQNNIDWLIRAQFYRQELGLVKETDKCQALFDLASMVGWCWFTKEYTYVSRRPCKITVINKSDNINILHDINDMAIKYNDGRGCYVLNGIRIPKMYHWVFSTEVNSDNQYDKDYIKKVLSIKNVEVRSEVIKRMGGSDAMLTFPNKILDTKKVLDSNYTLYKLDVDGNKRVYLSMTCPSSGKKAFEAVHPDCFSVISALNWREEGIITDRYILPSIRT